MKTCIVLGTRPEIIKLAPLIKKLGKKRCSVVFSGQHYDQKMSLQFIEQLGLPKPDYSLKITHSNPSYQISEIIEKLHKILIKEIPDNVVIQGDTNTVLASGICAIKSEIPICHVESGLRSYDWRMPEEHNRITIDHLSEHLFCPTNIAKNNLKLENVHGKIHVVGNTIIDSVNMFSKISSKNSSISVHLDNFILTTIHRAENVDNRRSLTEIIKGLINSKQDIIFPIHPRTKKRLNEFGLLNKLKNSDNILLFDALGYFEMLELMKNCSFIVTDSGGIQEEATASSIQKKVLVIRKTSDRPESIHANMAQLVKLDGKSISKKINQTFLNPKFPRKTSPYGNGTTSQKIIKILQKEF
ncbi:UDP-N-acetylglucosamine 2-epimerase (non-hydrolyzing) [Nitrosopumilus sp.]|uniref:non-hydrolyzing UDP-N-acetylglucosamine 2-epimerase n=1 Tax=Nitrosopumilus sp. TaxID=2024843 RepID=UPI00247D3637|nr:UDP-N-acetylglucosamine 2-epimerase (non-hydrolyzing) [Nitrosopumilus sp.]MCV0430367.1 UDP-N-acetylglucosamine 2-epimerase (non-hydrolyzing) [Nitrosopumilus sp.]